MHRRPPGRHVTVSTADEPFKAFVPAPLPPKPALVWSTPLRRRFDDALVALGRLDAIAAHLPNVALLIYSFVRKEAVLSSQIEGTQSSLADLLLYEADEEPGVPIDDAREVSRCVAALDRGLKDLACRSALGSSATCIARCWPTRADGARHRGTFAARRSGLAVLGPATRCSYRPRPTKCRAA